jgi:nucleotidyltransferase substrate binding protein (TIGR01987 family)
MLDLSSLENALGALHRSIQVTLSYLAKKDSSADLKETLQAGVIQHFEFCYELSWKMLKRQLEQDLPASTFVDGMSYAELIREGAERGLIHHPERWLVYRRQRNLTSHTYEVKTANSVYKTAVAFYDDAMSLLEALNERNT